LAVEQLRRYTWNTGSKKSVGGAYNNLYHCPSRQILAVCLLFIRYVCEQDNTNAFKDVDQTW